MVFTDNILYFTEFYYGLAYLDGFSHKVMH